MKILIAILCLMICGCASPVISHETIVEKHHRIIERTAAMQSQLRTFKENNVQNGLALRQYNDMMVRYDEKISDAQREHDERIIAVYVTLFEQFQGHIAEMQRIIREQ